MADANDIRSLLTAKSRVKVAPRDASLNRRSPPVSEETSPERPQLEPEAQLLQPHQPEPEPAELDTLPTMGKRLAVHLEQGVRDSLVQLCDRQDITPEIFFEAATVFLQSQPELLNEVIAAAKVRLSQRKRAGLVRRTLAMMEKYGDSRG